MDAKITLSFDQDVIRKAKEYAESQHISLSRLTEYLLRQATSEQYRQLEDMPIADWVRDVAEGRAEYATRPKTRKAMKSAYFDSRK